MLAVEGCREAPVTGVRAHQAFDRSDWVAEEVPVALEYNGISHAVMLASPSDLEDFAFGFSLTEGIVDDCSQIHDIDQTSSEQGQTLHLSIAASCFARLKDRRRSMTGRTGCGLCGTESLAHAVRLPPRLQGGAEFDAGAITRALINLREQQLLLSATGATHAAAWCNADGDIVVLREDVGRHNALDKLIGALQRRRVKADAGFIVVTSRASYEMVHKTAMTGVTLLAAVSGVTGLAIDVAQTTGVALLGFVRGEDLSVYSHKERVNLEYAL
jgi:formate dehydrogenase accessory protein FdhD